MKNKSQVQEWFKYAKFDFDTVNHLYKYMRPQPLEIICYHSQQAAEKLLKALLTAKDISFNKSHDLTYLFDLYGDTSTESSKIYEACARLTPYGVSVRYPGGKNIVENDTKIAIQDMNIVKNWVSKEITLMQTLENKQKEKNEIELGR